MSVEVVRDFYVTQQRISTSCILERLSTSRIGCSRRAAPPPRYRVGDCLHLRAKSNFRFGGTIVAQTQVFFQFTQTFPEKILVSNHALLKSFAQRKEQIRGFPTRRPTGTSCTIVDRSMDPEVLTANGQLHTTTRLTPVFGRLPTAVAIKTHVALFRPSGNRKPFLTCFQNPVAKNVHLVAMMRLVFGF